MCRLRPTADIYIADMHHQRIRKVDHAFARDHDGRRQPGVFGPGGDDGPATKANLAGPTGIRASCRSLVAPITILHRRTNYNQMVARGRAGRHHAERERPKGRVAFGAPSRVAVSRSAAPKARMALRDRPKRQTTW